MAATGKKSKKAKWLPASITDIIAEPTTIPAANSWADSVDDEPESTYGGYSSRARVAVVLPSASRAARGGMAVDDESIPQHPPFIAHISNLPYDVDESAITDLFAGLKIINLRLPRESDRLKGYGYVDFEDRQSLIDAMNIADLTIGGRRIRIGVSTHENDRRMGRGGRNDRERDYDPERTMGDWRSGPRAAPEPQGRGERERERPRVMDRENMRERDSDRDRERPRDSSADNRPGGWRDGERAAPEPARTPYGGRDSFGRDRPYGEERGRERSGYGGRDGFRTAERDGGAFGSREGRGYGGRGFGDRDRDPPPKDDGRPRERPKLNLLPRTVPRSPEPGRPGAPEPGRPDEPEPRARAAPAEKVFGAAKPVDTAAKEREIEERLLKQEGESRRVTDDKERWGRRNDHSGDRRGGARRDDRDRGRDDRARDSRSFNRDRRDYSKDDNERRDYSKDDRDRRDADRDVRREGDRDNRREGDRDFRRDGDRDVRRDGDRDVRRDGDRDIRRDGDRDIRRDGDRDIRRDGDRDIRRDGDRDIRRDGDRDIRREGDRDIRRDGDRDIRRDYRDDRDRRDYNDRDRRDYKDDRERRDYRDDRDRRDNSGSRRASREDVSPRQGSRTPRQGSLTPRQGSRDASPARERHPSRDREPARDRQPRATERDERSRDERNGRARQSRERADDDDDKLPKLKEQEKPNFVASNKFSFLEDADGGTSD